MSRAEIQDQPLPELPITFQETVETRTLRDRASIAIDGYRGWAEAHPFAATTVETTALFAVRQLGARLAKRAGLDVGNAFRGRHVEAAAEHPVFGALQAIVMAPVMEEVAFRGVMEQPARHAEAAGRPVTARTIRMISTLGFAASHSGIVRPADSWPPAPYVQASTKGATLPLEQLAGGLNYSRLNRTRGFSHAAAAHAINNALSAAVAAPEIIRRRRSD